MCCRSPLTEASCVSSDNSNQQSMFLIALVPKASQSNIQVPRERCETTSTSQNRLHTFERCGTKSRLVLQNTPHPVSVTFLQEKSPLRHVDNVPVFSFDLRHTLLHLPLHPARRQLTKYPRSIQHRRCASADSAAHDLALKCEAENGYSHPVRRG